MFHSDLGFPKTGRNGKLPVEFLEIVIADKVSKVAIFENTYIWVTFGKSFIFCICMLVFLFLVHKSSLKRQNRVTAFMF